MIKKVECIINYMSDSNMASLGDLTDSNSRAHACAKRGLTAEGGQRLALCASLITQERFTEFYQDFSMTERPQSRVNLSVSSEDRALEFDSNYLDDYIYEWCDLLVRKCHSEQQITTEILDSLKVVCKILRKRIDMGWRPSDNTHILNVLFSSLTLYVPDFFNKTQKVTLFEALLLVDSILTNLSSILTSNVRIRLLAAMSLLATHTSSDIVRMCIKLINNLTIDIQSIPDFLEELSYVIDIDGFDSSPDRPAVGWTSLNENIMTCLDRRVYDNLSLSLSAQEFVSRLKLKGETKTTVINIYGAYGTHWVANMKLWPFTNIWEDIYDKIIDQEKNYPMTEGIDNELTVSLRNLHNEGASLGASFIRLVETVVRETAGRCKTLWYGTNYIEADLDDGCVVWSQRFCDFKVYFYPTKFVRVVYGRETLSVADWSWAGQDPDECSMGICLFLLERFAHLADE